MSFEFTASTRSRMPASRRRSAAKRTFSTTVRRTRSGSTPCGVRPERQFSCRQPSAVAYSIARPTASRNSPVRSGRQASPRSPASQFPGGRLCRTWVSPFCRNASAIFSLGNA